MASVSFEFECSKEVGFVMDPNEHATVGWVIELDGFGLPAGGLKADLTVSVPMPVAKTNAAVALKANLPVTVPGAPPTAKVVGVLEQFSWAGGAGDPLHLDFWVSQENATQIKALQQMTLKNSAVKAAFFEVAGYDQEIRAWFTQLALEQSLSGIITGNANPQLDVDLTPVQVKDGIDVNVYKISIAVSPAANQAYTLLLANSSARKVVKSWGLVVGSLSQASVTASPPK